MYFIIRSISAKDVGQHIALNLRGKLETLSGGARIKVFNTQWDAFLILTLILPTHSKIGGNLSIETGSIRRNLLQTNVKLMGIEDLYITWETPMSISFVFVHGNRFEHINILADTTVSRLSGIDLRQKETKPAHKSRRTFYLIVDPIETKSAEESEISGKTEEDEFDNEETV